MNDAVATRVSSALSPAGLEALAVAEVSWVLIALVTAVFVLTLGLLARALWGRGRRPVSTAAWVLGGGVAFPVVVLTGLLLYGTWRTAGLDRTLAAPDLVVNVTGHLWWWDVRVHDPRSGRQAVLANELRVPVGRSTQIALQSADVIHSFWVPEMGGKRDLVPGRVNHLVVTPTRPGVYRGQCAEYCGLQHAKMALHVVAMPAAEFDAWLASQVGGAGDGPAAGAGRGAPSDPSPRQARGRERFVALGCANCHAARGVPLGHAHGRRDARAGAGGGRPRGPDLTHVATRPTLGAGALPNGPGAVRRWLVELQTLKPGARMPSYAHLDTDTLDALAAYLEGSP